MRVNNETITPALAAEYLKANTSNRPCSVGRVAELANAMKRGEWMPNGDAIRFSVDGVLLDGQGRLKACISSGISFTSLVVRDLPREAFKTMDLGKKRNLADLLAIDGEKNTTKLARALRFTMMYEAGSFNGAPYSPQQLENCLRRHPGIRNWMSSYKQMYKVTGHGAIVLAVCYLGSLTLPRVADDFTRLLLDGAGLEKGSPVLTLRDRLQQDRAATSKLPASYVAQLVIHAYNAFAKGDSRAILKGNRNNCDLPRLVSK
jgi:hypothetical protein